MNSEEIKGLTHQYIMNTYGRFPVAVDHGAGARLYDPEGRAYVDFTSGIGVTDLGYGYQPWVDAIAEQAKKLGHVSNLFYTEPSARLAEILCKRTGMSNAFFANGGGEANEGMIKLARKYSFDKYGKGRSTIITLNNSFHGRTITTLTATGQEVFHNYFFPFTEGFRYADANSLESLEAAAGDDVCAVMVELIQGEGGVLPLSQAYVDALAELCAQRDWLLLVDEVQSGIGRTGSLFCFQQIEFCRTCAVLPRVMPEVCLERNSGQQKCRAVLGPGTHATTFGANPVCAAAGLVVQRRCLTCFGRRAGEGPICAVGSRRCSCPASAGPGHGLMVGIEVRTGTATKKLPTTP
jgi:acetylornithine/N-succinyldiaminopimelate aminotransferase